MSPSPQHFPLGLVEQPHFRIKRQLALSVKFKPKAKNVVIVRELPGAASFIATRLELLNSHRELMANLSYDRSPYRSTALHTHRLCRSLVEDSGSVVRATRVNDSGAKPGITCQ